MERDCSLSSTHRIVFLGRISVLSQIAFVNVPEQGRFECHLFLFLMWARINISLRIVGRATPDVKYHARQSQKISIEKRSVRSERRKSGSNRNSAFKKIFLR